MKIGPKYKIARRLGDRVFPKTQNPRFSLTKEGGRGSGGRPKPLSDFGRQLIEKQKARYTYVVTEKQFGNYVKRARQTGGTDKVGTLYRALESRLDNVIFRLGLANSRLFGRQLVSHGHILVNGKKVTIPSYEVKAGDRISIRPGSAAKGPFKNWEEKKENYQTPEWLVLEEGKASWQVKHLPLGNDQELTLNFGAILEFYSRG